MEETKAHVLAAGRELLLAAQGALNFCKTYAETQAAPAARPHLIKFFKRALTIADELGKGLAGVAPLKRAAKGVAKPLFDAMEREMRREASRMRHKTRRETPSQRKRTSRKTASRRKGR